MIQGKSIAYCSSIFIFAIFSLVIFSGLSQSAPTALLRELVRFGASEAALGRSCTRALCTLVVSISFYHGPAPAYLRQARIEDCDAPQDSRHLLFSVLDGHKHEGKLNLNNVSTPYTPWWDWDHPVNSSYSPVKTFPDLRYSLWLVFAL